VADLFDLVVEAGLVGPVSTAVQLKATAILRGIGLSPQPPPNPMNAAREVLLARCNERRLGRTDRDRVYLVQAVDGGPIKIGHSGHLMRRLGELQRSSPVKLRVIFHVTGGEGLERYLHEAFAGCRLHGKWFSPETELLQFIEAVERGVPT
jgi:hypothetical protein